MLRAFIIITGTSTLASSGSICILFAERIAPLRLNILSQLASVARAPNTRLAMWYSVGCGS